MKALGLAMTLFSVACSSSSTRPTGDPASGRNAVREWLTNNLDDPNFEEVQWWPSTSLKGAKTWSGSDDWPHTTPTLWKSLDAEGTAIRLKYRTKNRLGARELRDEVFWITDGMVTHRIDSFDFMRAGESIETWTERMRTDPTHSARIAQYVEAQKQTTGGHRPDGAIRTPTPQPQTTGAASKSR